MTRPSPRSRASNTVMTTLHATFMPTGVEEIIKVTAEDIRLANLLQTWDLNLKIRFIDLTELIWVR